MTNYNNNMNKAPFYRPTSMGSIRFHEPIKAQLIDAYFGRRLSDSCVPTVNCTFGIISDTISHITKNNEYGYVGEILAVRKSCENGNPVHLRNNNKSYPQLNGCIIQYVADVAIGVLKAYMEKNPQRLSVVEQYEKCMEKKNAEFNVKVVEENKICEQEKKIKELEKMNKELSKENKKIKRENRKLTKENKATTKELKKTTKELTSATKKLNKIASIVNN